MMPHHPPVPDIFSKKTPAKPLFCPGHAAFFVCLTNGPKRTAVRARIPAKPGDDYDIFHSDHQPYNLNIKTGDYTMNEEFCTRTARKMRKFGVAPKLALFYSRFFYLSMLSVSGIMITCMRRRKGVKVIGEETPRSLRHTLAVLIASTSRITGAGMIIAGPPAAGTVPASSRIHRH